MFSNVVVGLKEGQDHESLLRLALSAAADGARIHLVTLLRIDPNEDELQRIGQTERALARRTEALSEAGYDATQYVGLVTVAAASDLLNMIGERGADLAVIGLAKRTRVGKALMGSDAQRVLIGAPCPVLVKRIDDR